MARASADWRGFCSPLRPDDALDRRDGLAGAVLALMPVWVFRLHLFGVTLFLGNPDRLNNNLKVQKYFVDSLSAGLGVQAWNDHELLGYNTLGLPYTFPNPLSYVMALFGPDNLYATAGYLSALLLALAGFTAYLFLRDVVRDKLSAFVGAALYQLCTLTVLKVSQNDMSFIVLALCPLLFLQVRASAWQSAPARFLWSTLILTFYLQFAFLQKVAYVVAAAGFYAAFVARARKDWAPLIVYACAGIAALAFASPRLIGLVETLQQYTRVRASIGPYMINGEEILRFFDPFAFGHSFTGAIRLGNNLNLSEGWLIYLSGAAPALLLLALWSSFRRRDAYLPAAPGLELFFLWACVLVAAGIVFNEYMARAMRLLFLRMDFIHARVLIVATLPACALLAGYLALLRRQAQGATPAGAAPLAGGILAAGSLLALIHWIAHSAQPWSIFPLLKMRNIVDDVRSEERLSDFWIAVEPSLRALLTLAAAIGLIVLVRRKVHWSATAWYTIAAMLVLQALWAADRQVNGDAVTRAPVPFANGDLFQAPRSNFAMPSAADRSRMRDALETERFRSIAVCDPKVAGGFCAAHVGERWGLRLADGYYGLGIPKRVAELPLGKALGLRHLIFTSVDQIPWDALGLVNVKYALVATPEIYGNSATRFPAKIERIENPRPVTPRAFFTQHVRPVPSAAEAVTSIFASSAAIDVTKTSFVESFQAARDFPGEGAVQVEGSGDSLEIRFQPRPEERFLVVNELFDPRWKAVISGVTVAVYATNAVMRGVLVPGGANAVTLEYEPFPRGVLALLLRIAGVAFGVLAWLFLRRSDKIPR
jgi:hypothetical protein